MRTLQSATRALSSLRDIRATDMANDALCRAKKRYRTLTSGTKAPKAGDEAAAKAPVIYWMSRDQRVRDNWALLRAIDIARANDAPVVIAFNLLTKYLGAGARQFGFMLRGLRELEGEAKSRGLRFTMTFGDDPAVAIDQLAEKIGAKTIVCDFSPLRDGLAWRKSLASRCESRGVHVEECDAHNVVPCWEASDKLEVGARTLRGRLAKRYHEFLHEFPEIPSGLAAYEGPKLDDIAWDKIIAEALERGQAVPEVTWAIPGETAAAAILDDFVNVRMRLYESRNDPVKPQALSGLSPWLHFGQISGQRCALDAKKACGKASPKAYESFFEELVVRRELSDNFCYYSPKYDSIEGQKYDWAKDTLRIHASDKRPYVYTLEEFERAKTHDDLWNAAQRELRYGGKMHGFLRMYWAKKILEWTASPEQALEFAIFLNDKYSLDGRDPSGYVGCMWSIVGVHDQGWKERDVFGKIRYMAYDGCAKKFRIPDYIARVNALVKAAKSDFKSGEKSSAANPGLFKINVGSKRKAGEA
jgi:deoxyribodipyrimidine photo-lyase